MPPKKSKVTLTSSDDSEDASLVPSTDRKPTANSRMFVESSAIKKSRGRPRKQPTVASGIPEDPDDSLALASQVEIPLETKKPVVEQKAKEKEKGKRKGKEKGKGKGEEVGTGGEDISTKDKPTNPTKAVPNRKKAVEQRLEIPETQAACGEISESEDEGMDISQDEEEDSPPNKEKNKKSKAGKISKASGKTDPDGLADELAQLKLKYEKLRRLQTDDADAIHAEQIKTLEERDKASQRIIENLKAELKSRSISLQQLQEKDRRIQELEKQNSLMEDKIGRLLQDHAVLSAKLETARNIGKTPSNNSKAIAPSGASKEFSQHRENLYSDLCGLIVVNVKSDEDGGIEYDCLSTGKNGALHFKLQLDAEDDEDEVDDDGPYFTYNPMLERGRDERLIAVLPPIFRDEMNFKRTRGVDFYLQLMQSLQSS
ncbi:uncharacterized protein DFL_008221 [Arthrobotrys flagrans]|uniref:Monopolin complex subunit Csm1/Pcs1 C-terminal domain-containing protein n=1 Tax=Arthrobotrys flagrans TaxID=97331 RepID=A0A436ZN49_ARTFL|nr:hypothetical protein DFL_008221 [Arthrobotrys flagrans]